MRHFAAVVVVIFAVASALQPRASAAPTFEVWLSTQSTGLANGTVYRLDSSGTQLGSFALASGEHGGVLQLDSAGNVYTGRYETLNGKVVRHTATGGAVGGEGTDLVYGVSNASLGGMWLNGNYLYVSDDQHSPSVRIIDLTTKTETAGSFSTPTGAALDVELGQDGKLYVATTTNRIYRYTGSNASWTFDSSFYFGDGQIGTTNATEGIAVDASGNIYIAAAFSAGSGKVFKYTNGVLGTPTLIDVFADWGGLRPIGLEVGPDNKLYIGTYAMAGTNKILRYNLDGTKDATLATPGLFASGYDFAEQVDFKILPVPEPTSVGIIAVGAILSTLPRRGRGTSGRFRRGVT